MFRSVRKLSSCWYRRARPTDWLSRFSSFITRITSETRDCSSCA